MSILKELNEILRAFESDSFANGVVLSFNSKKKVLSYSNASYLPVIVFHAESQDIISYDVEGFPLGIENKTTYKAENLQLQTGDIVILQSENLLQGESLKSGFGMSQLAEMVGQYKDLKCEEIVEKIVTAIRNASVEDSEDIPRMIGMFKVL